MSSWSPPPPPVVTSSQERSRTRLIAAVLLLLIVVGLILFFLGRGSYRQYRLASAAADRFHQHLNAEQYNEIWNEASDDFRNSASLVDLVKFFEMVHQKLGHSGKMNMAGFHVNWKNGRVWVDQLFNTQFDLGQGQESFIWVQDGSQLRLYHYQLNSANLK